MRKIFQILLAAVMLMSCSLAAAVDFDGDYIEVEGIVHPEGQSPLPLLKSTAPPPPTSMRKIFS